MSGVDDEMFMIRSLNVTPKTIEQHLIARSNKSVAYLTNNKRLFVLLKLTTDRHQTRRIVRPFRDSRAICITVISHDLQQTRF